VESFEKLEMEEGQRIFPLLARRERGRLARALALCMLSDSALQKDDLAERILTLVAADIDTDVLVSMGLSIDQDGLRVSRVLIAFNRASAELRSCIVDNIQQVVEVIIARRKFDLTSEGSEALAQLIDAAAGSRIVYLRVCSSMLPFAMDALQRPASALIIAAFPPVYQELSKDSAGINIFRFFSFVDWDKCKAARKALVRAFLSSNWPPVDLAIVGQSTGDLDRIFQHLVKEPRGETYLSKIETGIERLRPVKRVPIQRAIRKARKLSSALGRES
jgi:hypothetical protein